MNTSINQLRTFTLLVSVPFENVEVEVRGYSLQHAMKAVLIKGNTWVGKHDIEVGEITGVREA